MDRSKGGAATAAIAWVAAVLFGANLAIVGLTFGHQHATEWHAAQARRRSARLRALVDATRDGDAEGFARLRAAVGPADVPVLATELEDEATVVRGEAAEWIAHVYALVGCLDRTLRGTSSRFWWRRADAAERLGRVRHAGAAGRLAVLARDNHPRVRLAALRSLRDLGDPAWRAPAIALLASPPRGCERDVRDLFLPGGLDVVPSLCAAAAAGTEVQRANAVHLLGILRAADAMPVLEGAAQAPEATVRAAAAVAMGRIGVPGPALSALLEDPVAEVRARAAAATVEIGGGFAAGRLQELRLDADPWVRLAASGGALL